MPAQIPLCICYSDTKLLHHSFTGFTGNAKLPKHSLMIWCKAQSLVNQPITIHEDWNVVCEAERGNAPVATDGACGPGSKKCSMLAFVPTCNCIVCHLVSSCRQQPDLHGTMQLPTISKHTMVRCRFYSHC